AAYRDTLDIYQAIGLGDGLDAQIVRANVGTLELRTGHLKEAAEQLKGAFERERALAGNSAAVAAAMGYYGRVQWIFAQYARAVEVLREAAALAAQYAGATSPVALQNRLFLGDAQLSAGDQDGARVTLSAALEAARAQYGEAHLLSLRARLAFTRWSLLAGGDAAKRDSQEALLSVVNSLRK